MPSLQEQCTDCSSTSHSSIYIRVIRGSVSAILVRATSNYGTLSSQTTCPQSAVRRDDHTLTQRSAVPVPPQRKPAKRNEKLSCQRFLARQEFGNLWTLRDPQPSDSFIYLYLTLEVFQTSVCSPDSLYSYRVVLSPQKPAESLLERRK